MLKIHRYEIVFRLMTSLIRWAGLGVIAYLTYKTVDTLAGQITIADIGVELGRTPSPRVSQVLMALLTGLAIAYGFFQRNLRKNTVERLQKRIQELETGIDPNRTSSNLTPRGDTRPEDRI